MLSCGDAGLRNGARASRGADWWCSPAPPSKPCIPAHSHTHPPGPVHVSDHHLVQYVLGDRASTAVAATQALSCVLGTITYSIAGSNAMQQFMSGTSAIVMTSQWEWLLVLGGVQLFLSQVGVCVCGQRTLLTHRQDGSPS